MAADDEFTPGAASTAGLVTSAALAAHEADTTAVHGVVDTSKVVLTNVANTLTSPAAGSIPVVLKGAASQTASLTEWRDSLDGLLALVSKDGSVHAPLGALLGAVEAAAAGYAAGFSPRVAGEIALLVQGVASQTGDLVLVRSSALVSLLRVLADGGIVSAGDLKANTVGKGLVTRSPDGTPYRLNVANGGAVSTSDASEVLDSFTRANETPLGTADTGQAWTTAFGSGLSVISNQCGPSTAADRGSVINPGFNDFQVSATLAAAGAVQYLVVRWTDANNYLVLDALGRLMQTVAGSTTSLGTMTNDDWLAGERIAIRASGSAVTCYRDGVQELATVTTLLTGWPGLRSSSTATRFDNFAVRSL